MSATTAKAFDKVVHYSVVYAIAVAHGCSPDDAATIAKASQSLDDNDTTTAFSGSLIGGEMIGAVEGKTGLSELPHMISGQIFHALTAADNRKMLEEAHIGRIKRVFADNDEPGTPEQKRQRALVYFGEYLHFVADEVVHPNDSLLGHGPADVIWRENTDRADLHPDKLLIMEALIDSKIVEFGLGNDPAKALSPENLKPTAASEIERVPSSLDADPKVDLLLKKVAGSVVESWSKTYPQNRRSSGFEDERFARAASEIARILKSDNLEYRAYNKAEKIYFDTEGEPSDGVSDKYGNARRIGLLPFASTLGANENLRAERLAELRDFGQKLAAGSDLGFLTQIARDMAKISQIDEQVKINDARVRSDAAGLQIDADREMEAQWDYFKDLLNYCCVGRAMPAAAGRSVYSVLFSPTVLEKFYDRDKDSICDCGKELIGAIMKSEQPVNFAWLKRESTRIHDREARLAREREEAAEREAEAEYERSEARLVSSGQQPRSGSSWGGAVQHAPANNGLGTRQAQGIAGGNMRIYDSR